MNIKRIGKNILKTGALILVVGILLSIFAVLFALAPESTQEKLQRERWEQSPYGG